MAPSLGNSDVFGSQNSINGEDSDKAAASETVLNVIIVGGGLGGLAAAIALRQQGHKVEIFEQSRLANEAGAAIHIVPNANSVLRRLGINVEDSGANLIEWSRFLKSSGELLSSTDNKKTAHHWKDAWLLAHRAQLHEHLKTVATSSKGTGRPAQLHTASRIVNVDPHAARVSLHDGNSISADVVIGADGVHSLTRLAVTSKEFRAFKTRHSAFRFMITRKVALEDPDTREIGSTNGSMDIWYSPHTRIVMYPCSNNELLNFVCIHPAELSGASDGYDTVAYKKKLLEVYKDFAPQALKLLEKADPNTLKVYPLYDMEALPTFINDRLALIGDAAHPFLPHLAQCGAMALEDAASLGIMLSRGITAKDIPERLKLYNQARYERATSVQYYTRMVGEDGTEGEDRQKGSFKSLICPLLARSRSIRTRDYRPPNQFIRMLPGLAIHDYIHYAFSHDEYDASTQVLRTHEWKQQQHLYWREPVVFGPMPGPRQDHCGNSRRLSLANSTCVKASIKFKTSATFLRNLFKNKSYSFGSNDTVAYASFVVQTFDKLEWLAGGGYSVLGLYVHNVQYKKLDGEVVHASYLPVMFENEVENIISGREELGFPKVYSHIEITEQGDSYQMKIGLRGAVWGTFQWPGLAEAAFDTEQPDDNDNILVHKYIPATGGGSKGPPDADYDIFVPHAEEAADVPSATQRLRRTADASFKIIDLGPDQLPTLHHIVSRLAEMPVFEVVEATMRNYQGVGDFSSAQRLG